MRKPMNESKGVLGKIARQALGWNLVALGIAGLVLPILPGWLLIGWGAITLAPDFPVLQRLLARLERKIPQLKAATRKLGGERYRREPVSAGIDGRG